MDRYHHGDLENALLDAALARLSAGQEPSLREIARVVGVSAASVYHHFADKAALRASLAVRGFDVLFGAQRDALTDDDPVSRVLALGRAYLAFAAEHPALYRVMMQKDLLAPEQYPALEAAAERTLGVLVGAVAEVVGPPHARSVSLQLWASAHGFASLWDLGPLRAKLQGESYDAVARAAFEAILLGTRSIGTPSQGP